MIFCGSPSSKTCEIALGEIGDQAVVLVHHGRVQGDLVHFLLEDVNIALFCADGACPCCRSTCTVSPG